MDNNIKNILNIYDQIFNQKRLLETVSNYSPVSNVRPNQDIDLRLEPSMSSILNNVAKEYGKTIRLTSAYRSKERNAAAGGEENSLHLQGKAVDLVLPDMTNQEDILNFIQIASRNGVGGIGVYKGHIHLDNGSKRYWGDNHQKESAPKWAKETLEKHVKGELGSSNTSIANNRNDLKLRRPEDIKSAGVGGFMSNLVSGQNLTSGILPRKLLENISFNEIKGKDTKYNYNGKVTIPSKSNNKIYSSVSGKCVDTHKNSNCRNQILIEFKEGRETKYLEYCGITSPNIKPGDSVSKNSKLGTTSNDVTVSLYDSYYDLETIENNKKQEKPTDKSLYHPKASREDFLFSLFDVVTKPLKSGWESPTSGKEPNIKLWGKSPTVKNENRNIHEQVLKNMGIMNFRDLFNKMPKELQKRVYELKKIPQNKKWHPEGNVLKHTITVVNRSLKSDDINLAIAAIMHDIGKDETLKYNEKTNEPTAYGHENVSADLVKKYVNWIESVGGDPELIHFIVKNHMAIKYFDQMKPSKIEKITSNPNYDKLSKFGEFDKGGLKVENKKLQENINRIKKIMK